MYTKLRKINAGFTIVETLIVLAIAALIITIVLIAVPDLQRSSRNTDILHDSQNIASAIQSYEGNNDGAIPTNTAGAVSGPTITVGASGATSTATVQTTDSVYWATSNGAVKYSNPTSPAQAGQIGPGDIAVEENTECASPNTPAATYTPNSTADSRAVAVLYPIENSSNGTVACIQE